MTAPRFIGTNELLAPFMAPEGSHHELFGANLVVKKNINVQFM